LSAAGVGGRPNLAQAGGPDVEHLDDALKAAAGVVEGLKGS
jgi:alanyl-tRNA synthetase